MNFDFGAILDRFENKTRFLVLLVLGTVVVAWAVALPVMKAYLSSDYRDCTKCLEQNQILTDKIVEINRIYSDYVYAHTLSEIAEANERLASMQVELEPIQAAPPTRMMSGRYDSTLPPPPPPPVAMVEERLVLTSPDTLKRRERKLMRDLGKVLEEANEVKKDGT